MELLRGAAGSLRFPEHDGDPVVFDAPPVVAVVRHSDGSAVVAGAVTEEGEGADTFYAVAVAAAALAEVDLLVATWTGEVDGAESSYTTYTEVVGGQVVSLKAIERKYDEKTTDEDLAWAREAATTQIESACGVAFRARYGKAVLDGSGTTSLMLPQPQLLRALAVTVGGEEIDVETLTVDPAGILISPTRWAEGRANVEVAFVHGYENFPPAALPVRDLAAYLLTESPTDWNARATTKTSGDGVVYSLVTPGMRGASFPLPIVNAFVEDHEFVSIG